MRTNKKTMEEGPRGEGREKNAFSPRPLPHRFLFQPPFTFRAAVTLSSKHNKYRQLRRLACSHVGMLQWQELFWGDWTCNTVWRKPPGDAGSIHWSTRAGDSSENVTFKMNSRFFQTYVFPGADFLGTALKFRKRKKNTSSLVYVLHKA